MKRSVLRIFLTVISAKAYKQLHSLMASVKPGECGFAVLFEAIKNHYASAPSKIVQWFWFNSCFHQPVESISTYVAEFWTLVEFFNFGNNLNLKICDRLVCGIKLMTGITAGWKRTYLCQRLLKVKKKQPWMCNTSWNAESCRPVNEPRASHGAN